MLEILYKLVEMIEKNLSHNYRVPSETDCLVFHTVSHEYKGYARGTMAHQHLLFQSDLPTYKFLPILVWLCYSNGFISAIHFYGRQATDSAKIALKVT